MRSEDAPPHGAHRYLVRNINGHVRSDRDRVGDRAANNHESVHESVTCKTLVGDSTDTGRSRRQRSRVPQRSEWGYAELEVIRREPDDQLI